MYDKIFKPLHPNPPRAKRIMKIYENVFGENNKKASVTSNCLVVMFDSLQPGVQRNMMSLCTGRKQCVSLLVISQSEDIRQDPPAWESPAQPQFSLQTAWLVVKRVPRGYILRLSCSGRESTWLHSTSQLSLQIRRTTNPRLTQQIFQGLA